MATDHPMPAAVAALVERFTHACDADLRAGRALKPTAHFGKFGGELQSLTIRTASIASKQISVQKIRIAAAKLDADFVLVAMEAWGLPPEHLSNYNAILRDYGSIAASPFKTNLFVVTVETHEGTWSGSTEQVRHGKFGHKVRGVPDMLFVDKIEGVLAMLLMPRGMMRH